MRRGSGTMGGNSGVEVVRGGMTTPTRVPASVAQGRPIHFLNCSRSGARG